MSKAYLFMPLYDGRVQMRAANALLKEASREHRGEAFSYDGSLLPYQCTYAWCEALNLRDAGRGFDWFAILHDDIAPPAWWLDSLIALAVEHAADFMSAVVPIKSDAGLTSTGLWWPGSANDYLYLTTQQVLHPDFPATFGAREAADALARLPEPLRVKDAPGDILLANTGCMVCRLDRDWCDKVCFDNRTWVKVVDGKRVARSLSEDWWFSKAIADNGGKVMATKTLPLLHFGRRVFDSTQAWGKPRSDQ